MTAAKLKESAKLDPEIIAQRVEAVLADPLYWFPVRHHSPSVARHLEAALKSRRPKIIFIEGPTDANDLVRHIVDAKTEPPVAIYSSYRDDDNVLGLNGVNSAADDIPARFAAWYPLTAYSPEYVATKTAKSLVRSRACSGSSRSFWSSITSARRARGTSTMTLNRSRTTLASPSRR